MAKNLRDPARRFQHAAPTVPAKRPVNLSVDAELLKVAKEMNINLSKALEDALHRLTEDERAQRFYAENKTFFDRHNALAEKYGTLSEAYANDFGDDDQTV
jgi:antitoxin CcdA